MELEPERGHERFTPDEVSKLAKEMALSQGRHIPTIIAEGSHRSAVTMLSEFPDTHEEKAQFMLSVGFALGQRGDIGNLEQVFFISEAWMSMGDESGPPAARPSQDPNRKEILLIAHLALPQRKSGIILIEMVRDSEGQLVDLKDLQQPGEVDGEPESPLLDAFVYGFRRGTRERLN